MDAQLFEHRVLDFLDGRLSPAQAERLNDELAASQAARQQYWAIVETYEAIHEHFEKQWGSDSARTGAFEQGMAELLEHEQRVGAEPALVELPEDQWRQAWRERTIAGQSGSRDAEAGQMDASAATDARPQTLLEIGPLRVTRRRRPAGAHRGFGGGRLAWAAGLAAMLVMTVLLMQKPEHVGQPVVDVARVSDAVGAEWVVRDAEGAEMEAGVGDGLVAGGVLEVQRGFVELEMANETRVIVEGPSEVELQREALVRMQRGRLVARTNGAGETFTVVTPTASVTDLGTEFGVSVDEHGHTQTSVFEGLARVTGLGDGSLPRVRVGEGFTAAAMGEGEPTVRASDERDGRAFVRAMPANGYDALVQQSRPVAYWRLAAATSDGRVPEVFTGLGARALKMHGPLKPADANGNPVLGFDPSGDDLAYLSSDGLVESVGVDEHTIELWVKPEMFASTGTGTNSIVFTQTPHEPDEAFSVSSVNYEPRAHRFRAAVHPHRDAEVVSIFHALGEAQRDQWFHLVLVKREDAFAFYVNGQRAGLASVDPVQAEAFTLFLGRAGKSARSDRAFHGQMHSIALFDRALTREEIARRYERAFNRGEDDS